MDRLRYLFGVLTLAVLVGGGWFLLGLLEEGDGSELYQIEAAFFEARGLKPGADLKYRGIRIGSVRSVRVDETGAKALVRMSIEPGAERLIRDNTHFWIVTPRFHGISQGVSGLETLVRDAFVACATGARPGEPLPSGSRVVGDEAPVSVAADVSLPPINRGDLLMTLLMPDNEGLRVGSKVMFRGMPVGEVRSIRLAEDGGYVAAQLRVVAGQRSTVTDKTMFWTAQPRVNLQFSFSNPVSLDELGALISPFVAYYTPPRSGVPVPDGHRTRAELKRPDVEPTPVPDAALQQGKDPSPADVPQRRPLSLVRVVYEAEEIDYLSPNDELRREGTGLLYLDAQGRALVLTTRSVCDGAWFHREGLGGEPTIKGEKLGVQLADGQPLRANRIWTADGDADLAVLHVLNLPRRAPTTATDQLVFGELTAKQGLLVEICGERGKRLEPKDLDLSAELDLGSLRAGVVLHAGKVHGLLGQAAQDNPDKAAIVPLSALREDLRPKQQR